MKKEELDVRARERGLKTPAYLRMLIYRHLNGANIPPIRTSA